MTDGNVHCLYTYKIINILKNFFLNIYVKFINLYEL